MLYAPVIEPSSSSYLQAREGEEVAVTCLVHASPLPTIEWYRNGRLLAAVDTVTASRGPNHTLIIPAIGGRVTFGRYECRAVNSLGEAMRLTEVGGLADPAVFAAAGFDLEVSPSLAWTVCSLTPVTEFRLDYSPASAAASPESAAWRSLEVKAVAVAETAALYAGRLVLEDLTPGVEYSVRVASHNAYGWSPPTQANWTVVRMRPRSGRTDLKLPPPSASPGVELPPADTSGAAIPFSGTNAKSSTASSIRPSSLSSSQLSSSSSSVVVVSSAVVVRSVVLPALLSVVVRLLRRL